MGLPESGSRHSDAAEAQQWVDLMVQHGQPYIDTARVYGNGTCEKLISQLDLKGARVDTKVGPREAGDHAPARLRELFGLSREALGPGIKIRVFYLHWPDRSVPFEDTLETVNEFYKQGYFEELGLSNYVAWEVAEIVGICKRRGFVVPTVYQGVYNAMYRVSEAELFPCLRKFGIKFAAYSVLAGGLLTGKLLDAPAPPPGSHFDMSTRYGSMYNERLGHAAEAIRDIKSAADVHGLHLTDVAYRWLVHHSAMVPEDHGIVIGGSNSEQIEKALVECEKGPLPEDVVAACEEAWKKVRGSATPKYWV
ncbi:hypothetical protein EIP86_007711 [Pleurotus ostreatoroseus]|nr:hypothetical protein EIP86_007711 [Pleurotus ostreatoroseus]